MLSEEEQAQLRKRLSARLDGFDEAQAVFQELASDLETRFEQDFEKAEKRIRKLGGTVRRSTNS